MSGSTNSTQTTSVFSSHSDVNSSHLADLEDDVLLAIYSDVLPEDSFMKLKANQGTLVRDTLLLMEAIECTVAAGSNVAASSWHHSPLPKYNIKTDKTVRVVLKPNQKATVKNTGTRQIYVYTMIKIPHPDGGSKKPTATYDQPRITVQPGTVAQLL